MNPIIKKKPGEKSMITYIKKRIKLNKNFLALWQGETGIGKTWNAISVADDLSEGNFDVSTQLVFFFKDLIALINNPEFLKKKMKIIIWDEPQIEISNRAWQGLTNKLFNYILTTFRSQNIILFLCSPYRDFLDSQSMKLLHCVYECNVINYKENKGVVAPKLLQYNSKKQKTYEKYLRVITKKGIRKLERYKIDKPRKELIDVYEPMKKDFQAKLNNKIKRELDKVELKETNQDVRIDIRKPLTEKQENVMRLLSKSNPEEIAKKLGLCISSISRHKTSAEKKGYRVAEFKEETT